MIRMKKVNDVPNSYGMSILIEFYQTTTVLTVDV